MEKVNLLFEWARLQGPCDTAFRGVSSREQAEQVHIFGIPWVKGIIIDSKNALKQGGYMSGTRANRHKFS